MFETESVSIIIGLIERVSDYLTAEDLAKLDDDLGIEKTKFFNIVDDAERLGFVKVEEGNISLTPLGEMFSKASIQERKNILNEQIRKIEPFKTAIEILRQDEDKKMDKKEFMQYINNKFYSENPESIFRILINWGRYTKLFGYNMDNDEIHLIP